MTTKIGTRTFLRTCRVLGSCLLPSTFLSRGGSATSTSSFICFIRTILFKFPLELWWKTCNNDTHVFVYALMYEHCIFVPLMMLLHVCNLRYWHTCNLHPIFSLSNPGVTLTWIYLDKILLTNIYLIKIEYFSFIKQRQYSRFRE